jgi:hypothetical protein
MTEFTAEEKHAEAVREVEMRKQVYEGLVRANSLSQQEADRRIALMREIAEDYSQLAEKERAFQEGA